MITKPADARMRIVMVGPFGLRPRGTMSVRALPLAKALVARGHRVSLILPPWQNPEDAGKRWTEDGVEIENIDLPPRIPGLFHLLTTLRLTRRTLALRPDVVHLFKPKAYSGLTHALLARLRRAHKPHLVVDTDDWEGAGGWNEIAGYTWLQRRLFARQERWGLTHADAVTVASRTLESLVWALGVPPERVHYAPNGVWQPAAPMDHNAQEPPVILLYTRFFEFPVSRVIEVLRRVRESVPGTRLFVVGQGLFGEEKELFRLAAQAGLTVLRDNFSPSSSHPPVSLPPADVVYIGWVPRKALPACFALADLAIYPFDDTLINRTKCAVKLLDLLAAGVPVVAEAVGQNRETIQHGKTGWLVEPGNTAAFTGGVVHLLQDTTLRERLGQAAAHDVRHRLAWNHLVEQVERAYRR